MKIMELYDKTINDVAEVIADYLTVSESTFLRWYSKEFRIRFEQNLKKYDDVDKVEGRFKLDAFDSNVEMLELLNTQAEIISDLEKENVQIIGELKSLKEISRELLNNQESDMFLLKLIHLMEDYNLTWEIIYNIVQKGIGEGVNDD